jgi:8-oxo-dGTP diphosphatase
MADRFTTRMAIFVIMKNSDGEILLQQRANTGYLDGYYDFACSGHVDPDESIRQTVVRELMEEIGVLAYEEDLQLVHINQNNLNTPYTNFTFVLKKWTGTPKICEPEKCSDLAYFRLDAMPEKCTLNVRVNEKSGFSPEVTYSYVTLDNFEEFMGEPYLD